MQTTLSARSRVVPAIGGDLAWILGISLTGLLATAAAAVVAPDWVDVLNAWAWL
ncbi:MAG: hypothetical protein JOY66_09205 [Acetobacteraceae bacterium]|nr:hypothetical protein [Acetobacteraceae bacterium]